jgi:hypothetical protein
VQRAPSGRARSEPVLPAAALRRQRRQVRSGGGAVGIRRFVRVLVGKGNHGRELNFDQVDVCAACFDERAKISQVRTQNLISVSSLAALRFSHSQRRE